MRIENSIKKNTCDSLVLVRNRIIWDLFNKIIPVHCCCVLLKEQGTRSHIHYCPQCYILFTMS